MVRKKQNKQFNNFKANANFIAFSMYMRYNLKCEVMMILKVKKIVPNLITIFRLLSIIIGFFLFLNGKAILSIVAYILGSLSDFFDGYFARKWNASSRFGGFLDAVSDKLYALSIIILLLIRGNYLIIPVLIFEMIIAIINYQSAKVNGSVHTERVGKFKMTFEFILLIIALLEIEYKVFFYPFIILLVLTIYLQIECINAYINQKNKREEEYHVDYQNKNGKEKIKLLFDEFMHYLLHPVTIKKEENHD